MQLVWRRILKFQGNLVASPGCLRAPKLASTSCYCEPSLMLELAALIDLAGIGLMQPQIAIVLLVVVVLLGPRGNRSPRPCDLP